MGSRNAGMTDEKFESAVRSIADVLIQNGIPLQGCGCCGSVETEQCIFGDFTTGRDADGRWEVKASARMWDEAGNNRKTFTLSYTV